MTRKDYQLIAECLNKAWLATRHGWAKHLAGQSAYLMNTLVDNFCEELKRDNPKFDPVKFRKAVYRDDMDVRRSHLWL